MNVWCDLAAGVVSLGLRTHDGRAPRQAAFGGGDVRLRCGGRTHTLDPRASIVRTRLDTSSDGARLGWTSRLEIEEAPSRRRHVGDLTFVCTLSARSMFVDLECALDIAPDAEVSDVVLAFGCGQPGDPDDEARYEHVCALDCRGAPAVIPGGVNVTLEAPLQGCAYWSIVQASAPPGAAHAIHSLPRDPSRLSGLRVACDPAGCVQRASSEHRFDGPQSGRLVAGERKLLTSGGFYRDVELYADVVWARARAELEDALVTDISICNDYGCVAHGLASLLQTLGGRDLPVGRAAAEALRHRVGEAFWSICDAFERRVLEPARHDREILLYSRPIAYLALARATVAPSGDRDRNAKALRALCDRVMDFERINPGLDGRPQSGFVVSGKPDALPYVDCHAACLLALVRGSEALGETCWLDAIDRGMEAFCLDTQAYAFHGARKIDVVAVDYLDRDGVRRPLDSFWNFKSGLCLQLFRAVRTSPIEGLRAIWDRRSARLDLLELVLRARLERSLRRHPDGVEIVTSMLSDDTNCETQPWAALGLVEAEATTIV
jgi:hypothetical protein